MKQKNREESKELKKEVNLIKLNPKKRGERDGKQNLSNYYHLSLGCFGGNFSKRTNGMLSNLGGLFS
jgi:hypothetical protein